MEGRVETIIERQHAKNVLYLMQRDHRTRYNYSLELSYDLSYASDSFLYVGCDLTKIKKNDLQHIFIKEGLEELQNELSKLNIELFIISNLNKFIVDKNIDCIVTEFSPIREAINYQNEIKKICEMLKCSFYICDSHNIVPCKKLDSYCKSGKGVKSRLYKFWPSYFIDQKVLEKHKYNRKEIQGKNKKESGYLLVNEYKEKTIKNYSKFKGGAKNGLKMLNIFLKDKFKNFAKLRNKPSADCLTNISPWIHSGQLGSMEVIREAMKKYSFEDENFEIFLNEVFVWKETAEHFCYHNTEYDKIEGALDWAKKTLKDHSKDKRKKINSLNELESARTENEEWNCGMKEMILTGKMHGYVKIVWAKNLLFMTKKPEDALEYAIYLNDKYSIDANGPVEYAWIMYSICGVMDQGWTEREIIGKVRCIYSIKSKEYINCWKNKTIDIKKK